MRADETRARPDVPAQSSAQRAPAWRWGAMLAALLIMISVGVWIGRMWTGAPAAIATLTPTRTPVPATVAPTATPVPRPTPIPTAASLGIGSTYRREKDGMVMVYVPAGEFLMGRTEDNINPRAPQHTVYLDAFWVDRTEVTHAQYSQCLAAGACTAPGGTRWQESKYADHPVVNVDWAQAQAYCAWAGGRLPTEAEWEKAARGTDGRLYPWGNEAPDAQRANFIVHVGDTTPVGNYPTGASPYGALDMAGNVWEWTADWYEAGYYANSPAANPPGPASGNYRVLRGGGWDSYVRGLRVATRIYLDPTLWDLRIGFRCVAVPGR